MNETIRLLDEQINFMGEEIKKCGLKRDWKYEWFTGLIRLREIFRSY